MTDAITEITMPRLSDSMQEGTILTWLKADGEQVQAGDELLEIETDKATMAYESPAAGMLTIVAQAGETLEVGAVIATLGDRGAPGQAQPAVTGPASAEGGLTQPEPESAPAEPAPPDLAAPAPAAPEPAPPDPASPEPAPPDPAAPEPASPEPTPVAAAGTEGNGGDPAAVRATPLARRLPRAHGVDLAALRGTGPRGRITRSDVAEQAGVPDPVSSRPATAGIAAAPAP